MVDEAFILKLDRLRADLETASTQLRSRYNANDTVTSATTKKAVATIAETWMVATGNRTDLMVLLRPGVLAEFTVEFQRLLTYAGKATLRKKYDAAIRGVLGRFVQDLLVPLKQQREQAVTVPLVPTGSGVLQVRQVETVFIGHSFDDYSKPVLQALHRVFECLGVKVLTGEKPKADKVSMKVRERIEASDAFVGVFTRREQLSSKKWTTSTWVIDEKAWAFARGKKLVLLKEEGVEGIGGIQGDYEYISFTLANLMELVLKVLETFTNRES